MKIDKQPPYVIVFEDKQLLVVYKRREVFTIHTEDKKTWHHNLYYYLGQYLKKKGESLFIVHRLDFETSGLVVFAKSLDIKRRLQQAFVQHKVLRQYEAVVKEDLSPYYSVEIQQKLLEKGEKVVPVSFDEEGKLSITHVTYKNKIQIGSALAIEIETGRKNQIRLALSSLGLTLIGDKRYSHDEAKRMYLNAYRIVFPEECFLEQRVFETEPLWILNK